MRDGAKFETVDDGGGKVMNGRPLEEEEVLISVVGLLVSELLPFRCQ